MALTLSRITLGIHGKDILQDVSFTARDGEFLSLLGVSGAGKSTTLKVIAGLVEQDSGTVEIDGALVDDLAPHRRGATIVFQDVRLFPNMNVEENVAFPLRMQGVDKATRLERAREMLAEVQLGGMGRRKVGELSGGQQQRAGLARALAGNPHVLLLDEPFSGLDESLRDEMRSLVLRLHRSLKMTTVMVTHDATEALMMSDHVVYMHGGKVIQDDTPKGLYERPATADVAACFGDCCVLRGVVDRGVFSADGFEMPVDSDDGPADLAIRRHALTVDATQPTLELPLHCSVYHGCDHLLRFHLGDQVFEVPSERALEGGTVVGIHVDPDGAFVYPRS